MKLLYATDGSPSSIQAADVLKRLSWREEDSLLILCAAPSPHSLLLRDNVEHEERWYSLRDEVTLSAREAAGRAAEELGGRFASVETCTPLGHPAEAILQAARERSVDLIVVGSRGRSALEEWALGGVARSVVERAPCSVLVGRPLPEPLSSVLLAYDGSPESKAALGWAQALPLPPGAVVHVAGVAEPLQIPPAGIDGPIPASYYDWAVEYAENRKRSLKEALDRSVETLRESERNAVPHLLIGSAAEEVTDCIRHVGAELVLLGAHARQGWLGDFLGNTARSVVHRAACSVLVARTPAPAHPMPAPETSSAEVPAL